MQKVFNCWKKVMTENTSHEYIRKRAHDELAQLGIPVTPDDPTKRDVSLSIKMEGGSIRTDFDPSTPLARGYVVDIADNWDPTKGDNPTIRIKGKLFFS